MHGDNLKEQVKQHHEEMMKETQKVGHSTEQLMWYLKQVNGTIFVFCPPNSQHTSDQQLSDTT